MFNWGPQPTPPIAKMIGPEAALPAILCDVGVRTAPEEGDHGKRSVHWFQWNPPERRIDISLPQCRWHANAFPKLLHGDNQFVERFVLFALFEAIQRVILVSEVASVLVG